MLATLTLATALAVPSPVGPETRYDPRIPTLKQVTGHELGEEISTPDEIGAYLAALAAAAPDRARVVEYARSEEGRPLRVLVLGSPERMARLEAVQKQLRALADPRSLSPAEADRLVRELPAVVWLLHAVHGNEISSPDAALALAHHLLAAQDDPGAELVRREAIVLVDPLQNPDGRARFLASNALGRAARPDPEPASAEHDEPWPGGRGNHYLFDMNRDWFAQAQPETRGRLRLFLDWYPHVTVDLHEMGGDSTYYFAPPARPLNPYFSRAQQDWLDSFGRAIAARFDAAGQAYFVREVFDSFYPGYGESWPMGHGAVGMTFEQASARGLVWRREDDTRLTYLDGIRNHFRAALATVETAARGREKLLRDFLDFRRAAVRDGEQGPVRQYVLVPGPDPDRARRLADLLLGQGIEVRLLAAEARSGDRVFPAGSFVVPLAQPAGRLARNPARSARLDGRRLREGAGAAAEEAARRRDLRRDRLEPAPRVRRRVRRSGRAPRRRAAPVRRDAPAAPRARGGQGGLAAAVGHGDGRRRGRGAPGRAQGACGRGGLPARRPRVAGGDRDRASGREPGRHRRAARPDRAGARGRGRGGRLRLRRGGSLARERARPVPARSRASCSRGTGRRRASPRDGRDGCSSGATASRSRRCASARSGASTSRDSTSSCCRRATTATPSGRAW